MPSSNTIKLLIGLSLIVPQCVFLVVVAAFVWHNSMLGSVSGWMLLVVTNAIPCIVSLLICYQARLAVRAVKPSEQHREVQSLQRHGAACILFVASVVALTVLAPKSIAASLLAFFGALNYVGQGDGDYAEYWYFGVQLAPLAILGVVALISGHIHQKLAERRESPSAAASESV